MYTFAYTLKTISSPGIYPNNIKTCDMNTRHIQIMAIVKHQLYLDIFREVFSMQISLHTDVQFISV